MDHGQHYFAGNKRVGAASASTKLKLPQKQQRHDIVFYPSITTGQQLVAKNNIKRPKQISASNDIQSYFIQQTKLNKNQQSKKVQSNSQLSFPPRTLHRYASTRDATNQSLKISGANPDISNIVPESQKQVCMTIDNNTPTASAYQINFPAPSSNTPSRIMEQYNRLSVRDPSQRGSFRYRLKKSKPGGYGPSSTKNLDLHTSNLFSTESAPIQKLKLTATQTKW